MRHNFTTPVISGCDTYGAIIIARYSTCGPKSRALEKADVVICSVSSCNSTLGSPPGLYHYGPDPPHETPPYQFAQYSITQQLLQIRTSSFHHNYMATLSQPIIELCTHRIKVPREEAISRQTALIRSTISNAPGFLGLHWGFQLEDPTVLNWFVSISPFSVALSLTMQ
jgi:hypothetical protein